VLPGHQRGAINWRRLYTDSDSVTFQFKLPLILTAVQPPTERTDFADRCLYLPLGRPAAGGFEAASRLDAAFAEARPRLFGGLLTALARTLALLPDTGRSGLSRLGDFHWYGRAAAQALGCSAAAFDDALDVAVRRQQRLALEDPLAQALVYFADQHARSEAGWQGTARELLEALDALAARHHIARGPGWPRSADALGRRIDVLSEALRAHGIFLERRPRGDRRPLVLRYAD
jgi:hypothetical protein